MVTGGTDELETDRCRIWYMTAAAYIYIQSTYMAEQVPAVQYAENYAKNECDFNDYDEVWSMGRLFKTRFVGIRKIEIILMIMMTRLHYIILKSIQEDAKYICLKNT